MTRVQGDLKIITGTAEAVSEVWVRSKVARPVAGGWLMTANDRKPVFDGKVDLELLPGACVLVAVSSGLPGETVELIVPESGTSSLEACIRAAESAGDLERDALDELRRDFGAWLDEARASVSAAGESAKAAKTEAGKASTSATNADKSATAAAGSEKAAGKSAADSAASAKAAGKSAAAAASSAKAAKADAGKAANSATAASKSAAAAKADADRAEGVVDSVRWDGDKLTVAGKTSPSLRGEKGEPGPQGPPGEKSESGGVRGVAIEGTGEDPQATGTRSVALGWNAEARGRSTSALGIHTLASQNGSTAVGYNSLADDAQTTAVGFNSKATGFNSLALGHAAESRGSQAIAIGDYTRAASKASIAIGPSHDVTTPGETHIGVPKRRADQLKVSSHVVLHGTVEATEPAGKPEHLASKGYVDSKDAEVKALIESRPKIQVVSSMPADPDPNTMYLVKREG